MNTKTPKPKSKLGRAGYPITLAVIAVVNVIIFFRNKINWRVYWICMAIGTPLGWGWNWYLTKAGNFPAWIFPEDAVTGIVIFGIHIEDWFFYPITGSFFITLYFWDPLKKWIDFKADWLKLVLLPLLILSVVYGLVAFGNCGKSIAICYGIPAIIMFVINFDKFDTAHFTRMAIIIIPMEFIWDHWAVGKHQQWIYLRESGMFCDWWLLGVPVEMTPYLGIIATFFIYNLVLLVETKRVFCGCKHKQN
ncbi:MAG: hypothetical protein GY853_13930 [PVC group bacterium]|nr:hypothetical protein [PVC group bacterium]